MKLKKILPLTALASSLAIATPMITSCGVITQDIKGYTSKIEQHSAPYTPWDNQYATTQYFTNYLLCDVFKDDAFTWMAKEIKDKQSEGNKLKVNSLGANVSNIAYAFKEYGNINPCLFSYTIDLSVDLKWTTTFLEKEFTIEGLINARITSNGIPYMVQTKGKEGNFYKWCVTPLFDGEEIDFATWEQLNTNWSMDVGISTNAKINNISSKINTTLNFNKSSNDDEKDQFTRISTMLGKLESHYLARVTPVSK